jgi:4-hydroxy-tetrahydrodipicolinate reductase
VKKCFEANVPVVVGTTSWNTSEAVTIATNEGKSLFVSPNYSIGVNLFFELNKKLNGLMQPYAEYQLDMTELHHTQKKDAPSGTAITLAEDLINNHSAYQGWTKGTAVDDKLFPILSVREDPAPGKHEIFYTSEIDEIKISHEALNRNGFSLGAIYAANWIKGKKGVYHFADILAL